MDAKEVSVYQALMQLRGQVAAAHIRAEATFAAMAIRGVFVLNGVVGVGAFSATNKPALICCALGALFAILAAYFAYRTQEIMMASDLASLRAQVDSRLHLLGYLDHIHVKYRYRNVRAHRAITISLCGASLLAFVTGLLITEIFSMNLFNFRFGANG